ncbi:hypothetical protein QZP89_11135 [Citrobacter werkmanii]|uniref:Uncharacterized protein n=1 Tax=Citrobacter werkmanii TaxID=67827 RepID=A0AA37Z808_9ENTR|nr:MULTISPECIES: hypothetical protein [Citrobacter]MDN8552368.1 hypothetical protein [Citrobacter werkmanii]MDT0639025.1 hypothetical protein [Citrobacter werkmanii]MEC3945312.1 hypothetical protein [Citrobacter werkmanii]TKU09396.1 hypothetical protein FDW96_06500 [Citrobacter sp. TBCS-15]HAT7591806.1 hypothetical protein [Citrobacter werkmanii]
MEFIAWTLVVVGLCLLVVGTIQSRRHHALVKTNIREAVKTSNGDAPMCSGYIIFLIGLIILVVG